MSQTWLFFQETVRRVMRPNQEHQMGNSSKDNFCLLIKSDYNINWSYNIGFCGKLKLKRDGIYYMILVYLYYFLKIWRLLVRCSIMAYQFSVMSIFFELDVAKTLSPRHLPAITRTNFYTISSEMRTSSPIGVSPPISLLHAIAYRCNVLDDCVSQQQYRIKWPLLALERR